MGDLSDKRILVTGAGGFIGANLTADLLRRGARVHALVRPSTDLWRLNEIRHALELHIVDLSEGDRLSGLIEEVRPQIVFNSAAWGGHPSNSDERLSALRDNVIATSSLLEALRAIEFERLVHLGSSTEYGWKQAPIAESELLAPVTFRGVTKAASTLLCQQFGMAERRSVVIVRPFSVFGYWEPPSRIVPVLMLALLKRREMRLTEAGIRRDFIFIEDILEVCVRAASASNVDGEIFNAGSGQQWSNEELVEAAQQVAGIEIKLTSGAFPRRAADTDYWVAEIRKARRLLGWMPRYTLQEGLARTFAWFREHQRDYDRFTKS
jgi:UDP-glucose 4-epimerase